MLAEFVITPWHWATFLICILFMLALDLGVFHRSARVVQYKETLAWTAAWFCLAMGFAAVIASLMSKEKALLFTTGYIVELSLSMDNVFVIAIIFRYFQVLLSISTASCSGASWEPWRCAAHDLAGGGNGRQV